MNHKKQAQPQSPLHTLHNLQLLQLSQTFQTLDQDNDGLIKCSQLVELFSEVQVEHFNNLSYKFLLKLAQMKSDQLIDFNKFVEIVQGQVGFFSNDGKETIREGFKTIFSLYQNENGVIGIQQIIKIAERLGQPYNNNRMLEWVKEFGNRNGSSKVQLNCQDFYQLLTQKYN